MDTIKSKDLRALCLLHVHIFIIFVNSGVLEKILILLVLGHMCTCLYHKREEIRWAKLS